MTGIIIQARMSSTRLPGKILKLLGKKTLLDHIFFRISRLKHPVKIILATSDASADDVVEDYCKKNIITCFRGSEHNVLERYYFCGKEYSLNNIIRLTGDNPFPDVEEIDNLIDLFINEKLDFANSFDSLPVGVGAEIFTFKALEKSYMHGRDSHHLEHVDEYMIENPQLFKTKHLSVPDSKNHPDVRLTVDTSEDYKRACFIIENAKNEYVTTEEAIKLYQDYTDLGKIAPILWLPFIGVIYFWGNLCNLNICSQFV
jgi:spore coat polysaccharide biosynthesis protein SpsF